MKILLGSLATTLGLALGYFATILLFSFFDTSSTKYRYTLETNPQGASISLEGKVLGKSPLDLYFSSGNSKKYSIRISYPGYELYELSLAPQKEDGQMISLIPLAE